MKKINDNQCIQCLKLYILFNQKSYYISIIHPKKDTTIRIFVQYLSTSKISLPSCACDGAAGHTYLRHNRCRIMKLHL